MYGGEGVKGRRDQESAEHGKRHLYLLRVLRCRVCF
jgi:hypothetical protein